MAAACALEKEVLERFDRIDVQTEPERTFSSFLKGCTRLPVEVKRKLRARGHSALPTAHHRPRALGRWQIGQRSVYNGRRWIAP
jgi:hypothetical protein